MHPNVKVLIEREYAAQKSQEWLDLRGNSLLLVIAQRQ